MVKKNVREKKNCKIIKLTTKINIYVIIYLNLKFVLKCIIYIINSLVTDNRKSSAS